jgi:hypothetical protein
LIVDAAESQQFAIHHLWLVCHLLTKLRVPNQVAHAVDDIPKPELQLFDMPLALRVSLVTDKINLLTPKRTAR